MKTYKAKVLKKYSNTDYGYQANATGKTLKEVKDNARENARLSGLTGRIYLQFDEHPTDSMVNQTIGINC